MNYLREYGFTLDIDKVLVTPEINFVAGDTNSCVLNIVLTKKKIPIDLTNSIVQLNIKKADGTFVMQDISNGISIVDVTNGLIKIVLQDQSISAIGINTADISIDFKDNKLTTQQFKFNVRQNLDNDKAVASTSIIPLISTIQNQEYVRVAAEKLRVQTNNQAVETINMANKTITDANALMTRLSMYDNGVDGGDFGDLSDGKSINGGDF